MKEKKTYKIKRFYARSYEQKFATKAAAIAAIEAHNHRGTACYSELWEMSNDEDGEQVALFEYGTIPAQELVRK